MSVNYDIAIAKSTAVAPENLTGAYHYKIEGLPARFDFGQKFIKDGDALTCRIYNDIAQDVNHFIPPSIGGSLNDIYWDLERIEGLPEGWDYTIEEKADHLRIHVTAPDTYEGLWDVVTVGLEFEWHGVSGDFYATHTLYQKNLNLQLNRVRGLENNLLKITEYNYDEKTQELVLGVIRERIAQEKSYLFAHGFPEFAEAPYVIPATGIVVTEDTGIDFELKMSKARITINGTSKTVEFGDDPDEIQTVRFFVGQKNTISEFSTSLIDEKGTMGSSASVADATGKGAPFIIWDGGLPYLKGSRSKRLKGAVSPPDVMILPKGYPEIGYIEATRSPYPQTPIDDIVHLPDRRVTGLTFRYNATDGTRLGQTEEFSLKYQASIVEPNKNAILKHETLGRIDVTFPPGITSNAYQVRKDLEMMAENVIVPDIATLVNGGNLMLAVNLYTWEWNLYRFNKNKGTTAEVIMAQIWDSTFDAAHLYVLLDGTLLSSAWKLDLAKSTYSLWVRRCIDGIGETWDTPIEIAAFSDFGERDDFQPVWEMKQERTGTIILGNYKSDDMGRTWR